MIDEAIKIVIDEIFDNMTNAQIKNLKQFVYGDIIQMKLKETKFKNILYSIKTDKFYPMDETFNFIDNNGFDDIEKAKEIYDKYCFDLNGIK